MNKIKPGPIREKWVTISKDGKGKTKRIPAAKDTFFRTKAEGRSPTVTSQRKKIKFKRSLWQQRTLADFFRQVQTVQPHSIWDIGFENPCRKMTNEDCLRIMLADRDTEYMVNLAIDAKTIVIDNLNGE